MRTGRGTPDSPRLLPPYLLARLARRAREPVRSWALNTLRLDDSLRTAGAKAHALGPQPRPGAVSERGRAERSIHTAQQGTELPGIQVRAEGRPPTGDIAADEAYEHLGATYELFWNVYGRHSIDDRGMPLVGTVHYGQRYENAFWNGHQMVFGDGDGEIFNRFTVAVDIVGHELCHGVIDHEAALVYRDQPGALNESISDVFGVLVRQYRLGQSAEQADWLIGAGLFTEAVRARALRSMSAPGTAYDDPLLGRDPQPGHMRDFVETREDNGGVHINSGIPNKAFHLVATRLGGEAWERPGRIWYDTLCDPRMTAQTDFAGFAALTADSALRRHGPDSFEHQAVIAAWRDVGVPVP
jgi:Zn-dependent metalloprotease